MFIWASEVEGLQSSSQRLDCLTYSGETGSTCIASFQLEPYTPVSAYQVMYNACSDWRYNVWRTRTERANSSLCTHTASRASM
ncbi:hypothetical protein XELAEV_18005014mg [Xenopus laevis]|uniref:Uncharacterized protein n=1 Tax=Xenopus laevis TaxID=8355 RepID=A0A974I297_XENLA|nr:hypothetical protein XELAEV_18005014mg [Xenopus laevis]